MIDDPEDGSIMDDEDVHVYTINPEMAWAVRTSPSEVKIYLSEDETITLSQEALDALGKALDPFKSANPNVGNRPNNLVGQRFGRLTVISPISQPKKSKTNANRKTRWWCECDCGTKKTVLQASLYSGKSKSCGCYKSETLTEYSTTHGMSNSLEYKMYCTAKYRAQEHGLPFEINYADIKIPATCPIFGMDLVPNIGNVDDNSPTVDRIIPKLGYTKDNIWVISHRANRFKSNMTVQEMEQLLNAVKKKLGLP